jgi:hypothetical protein
MAAPSYWKLRRIGARTLRVLSRRKSESQAIAAHEPALAAKVQAYAAAFDHAIAAASPPAAVTALYTAVKGWLPILTRDIDAFDATDFGGSPELPEDVMADARRLAERVRDHQDVHGAALPYRDQCVAALGAAVTAAAREVEAREAADAKLRAAVAGLRTAGEALEAELQGVRRTLSARLGRQDPDFQKLRPQRAHVADADDDPRAPRAPAPVIPAAPGARLPV